MMPSGGESVQQQQWMWSPSAGWKIHYWCFHLLASIVPHSCINESWFWFRLRARVSCAEWWFAWCACAVTGWAVAFVSECRLRALARCSAGQRRHIKPGKLHQGNKMAIKWQQQCINPSPGSAGGTVKSSGWSREWFLGFISSAAAATHSTCQGAVRSLGGLRVSLPVDWVHINIRQVGNSNKKMQQLYIEWPSFF